MMWPTCTMTYMTRASNAIKQKQIAMPINGNLCRWVTLLLTKDVDVLSDPSSSMKTSRSVGESINVEISVWALKTTSLP